MHEYDREPLPTVKQSPAYFRFTDGDSSFVIELLHPYQIEHARRILNGEETRRIHVQGLVVKEPVEYNPGWSFHVAPASIGFFEVAIEVCDASIRFVEANLDEACSSTLPNCHWCPWSSRLVEELIIE